MIQAAARGVVDFSEADLLDRHWWIRLWWLLDQVERDNLIQIRRMQHAHNCALLDYNLDDKTFNLHWDQAIKALNTVWDLTFPWAKTEPEGSATDRLRQAWIERWGDPDSPETLLKIQNTLDQLDALGKRTKVKKKARPRIKRSIMDGVRPNARSNRAGR
jgi:hypothetical protein